MRSGECIVARNDFAYFVKVFGACEGFLEESAVSFVAIDFPLDASLVLLMADYLFSQTEENTKQHNQKVKGGCGRGEGGMTTHRSISRSLVFFKSRSS